MREITVNKPYEQTYNLCLQAARKESFKLKKENIHEGNIELSTSMSLRSFSETVTIKVRQVDNQKSIVKIKSHADYQLIDWGKSKENEKKLMKAINRLQQQTQQNQTQQNQTQQDSSCPTCGQELRWIEEYNRWYCDNCQEYK